MLLVAACPGCGTNGPSPCSGCVAQMRRSDVVRVPPSLDECAALLEYDGPAREVVAQLKYRNARSTAAWLVTGMAEMVPSSAVDLITWAPTTALRRQSRGFDHAELLARMIAKRCALPCRGTLGRAPGPPQTGRTLRQRARGPVFTPTRSVEGLSVVLIDDVITTGATLEAAGAALRSAGAISITGLAAAHPT